MVKVPIPNKNIEADSYSEVKYSANRLGTHTTVRNCSSSSTRQNIAIFYNLTADVVYSVCQFDYYYNTTVPPSILDGGSNILLANMLSPKRLICMEDSPMA